MDRCRYRMSDRFTMLANWRLRACMLQRATKTNPVDKRQHGSAYVQSSRRDRKCRRVKRKGERTDWQKQKNRRSYSDVHRAHITSLGIINYMYYRWRIRPGAASYGAHLRVDKYERYLLTRPLAAVSDAVVVAECIASRTAAHQYIITIGKMRCQARPRTLLVPWWRPMIMVLA